MQASRCIRAIAYLGTGGVYKSATAPEEQMDAREFLGGRKLSAALSN